MRWAWSLAIVASGCSSGAGGSSDDAGIAFVPFDGGAPSDAAAEDVRSADASADEGAAPASPFVTRVVSFTPGDCAGFGLPSMPGVVEGPPVASGDPSTGGTDVVSLGNAGTIVVSFEPNAIVDGPGPDFIVFENAFLYGKDDAGQPLVYAEPGIVSVSDDGTTWKSYPCTATADAHPDGFGQCAGWHVVASSPTNGVSPVDPAVAGGDAFDLADLGVTHARYVRIIDHAGEACRGLTSNGFDLDAVSIVHAELP